MLKNKKLMTGLLTLLLGGLFLVPSLALAQWGESTGFFPSNLISFGGGSLQTLVRSVINVLLIIAGVVAVVYLIIGGYQYVTSAGNAEQAAAGRTTVLNAIIGLVIILAAFLVINFVMQQIQFGGA
jgi:hypothetical protein